MRCLGLCSDGTQINRADHAGFLQPSLITDDSYVVPLKTHVK